jgi:hypothetical protein
MAEITKTEKDLRDISLFVPRFFTALSVLVAAMPILDRLVEIFPAILRYRDIATVLATIIAFAIIGGDFLSRKGSALDRAGTMLDKWYGKRGRPPTGAFMLIMGVLLSVGYIGYADYLQNVSPTGNKAVTNWWQEVLGIFWYLAIYGSLVRGLWQMAIRAYATRQFELDLEK